MVKLLGHSNNQIGIKILQIISYCFVFHETIEFFKNKKTPPEILKKLVSMFALLFMSPDLDVQLESGHFLTFFT